MAKLNLLTGSYSGKLGKTVGAKWKNLHTLRTLAKPTDPNTPAQQEIRTTFGDMSKFLALFTAELKTLSTLQTRGCSVRNAIVKVNKARFGDGSFDPALLLINKGSLPTLAEFAIDAPSGLASVTATWTPSASSLVSDNAQTVIIVASADDDFAVVATADQSTGTLTIPAPIPPSTTLHAFAYLLGKRGSTKVGGTSTHATAASPAA